MKIFLFAGALLLLSEASRAQAVPGGGMAGTQANNVGKGAVTQGDSALGPASIPGTAVPGTPTPDAPTLRISLPEKSKSAPNERKADKNFKPRG